MFVKQGDGKVLKIINTDDVLNIDEKKVAEIFVSQNVNKSKLKQAVKLDK